MVLVKVLVCVVRTAVLDKALKHYLLCLAGVTVKYVDSHLLGYRVLLLHILLDRLGRSCARVVENIEVSEFLKVEVRVLICVNTDLALILDLSYVIFIVESHRHEDLLLKCLFSDLTGEKKSCFLTSDRILYSDTVFNVLYLYLADRIRIFLCRALNNCIAKAVEGISLAAGNNCVVYNKLRKKLLALYLCIYCSLLVAGNLCSATCIIRVCKECLACSYVLYSNLSAIRVNVKLVAILLETKVHSCKLFILAFYNVRERFFCRSSRRSLVTCKVINCGGLV